MRRVYMHVYQFNAYIMYYFILPNLFNVNGFFLKPKDTARGVDANWEQRCEFVTIIIIIHSLCKQLIEIIKNVKYLRYAFIE